MVLRIVLPSSIATRATPVTADGVPGTLEPSRCRRAVCCEDDERDARGRGRRWHYYFVESQSACQQRRGRTRWTPKSNYANTHLFWRRSEHHMPHRALPSQTRTHNRCRPTDPRLSSILHAARGARNGASNFDDVSSALCCHRHRPHPRADLLSASPASPSAAPRA